MVVSRFGLPNSIEQQFVPRRLSFTDALWSKEG